jgi:hypothetical protein
MKEENQPENLIIPEQKMLSQSLPQNVDAPKEVEKINSFLRPESVQEADREKLEFNNIPIIPKSVVASLRTFLQNNPTVLHKFLLKRISETLKREKNEQQETKLFYLGDKKTLASLHREDYGHVLRESLKHFVSVEEYEFAEKCKEVLTSYTIEELIHSTKE